MSRRAERRHRDALGDRRGAACAASGAQRQVVLVTDGYVGGEQQIVTLLHESLPESCRLHVLGVGSAVEPLARDVARARGSRCRGARRPRRGRGASAKRLVDKTRAPVLTDLVISGERARRAARQSTCPTSSPARRVARGAAGAPEGGEIVVRGKLARGSWEQRIQVPAAGPGEGNPAVVKLYGRERVADLEMRWTMGNEVQAIDREIESIGMVFQIATRRTSWIAIDEDRSVDPRRGARHEEIPQELPYGTTMASFGGPIGPGQARLSVMSMGMRAPSAAMSARRRDRCRSTSRTQTTRPRRT